MYENPYVPGGHSYDGAQSEPIKEPNTPDYMPPIIRQRTPPPPPPVVTGPPAPEGPEKKPKHSAKRFVAAVAAALVIAGAAGSGLTYYLIQGGSLTQDGAGEQPAAAEEAPQSVITTAQNPSPLTGTGITEVAAKAGASVVEVSTEVKSTNIFIGEYVTSGAGSGVIITADGYIATNNHVIEDTSSIVVRTQDGTEYSATLVGTDSQTDIAVLKIDAQGLTPAIFADSDAIEVGQLAVAIGNPLGTLGGTVTDGIISAKDREITIDNETMSLLQTSAAVSPGNSGGGLFDANGNLVGLVVAKSSGNGAEGLGFAIPSNLVRQVADQIITNGYVTGRPEIGIQIQEINDLRVAGIYGLREAGLYVVGVTNEECELQAGDRIVGVNGTEISSGSELTPFIEGGSVGDVLRISVVRDGQEMVVSVTLREKVPDYVKQAQESARL